MQHGPRAAEKQTPRASSKTEEQVNLRASCFPGNAPSHEVLAVIQNRVIEILADACPCPLQGFFPRLRTRLVLPDRVGMAFQELFQGRDFDRSTLQSARQTGIMDDLSVPDVNTMVRDEPSWRQQMIADA
jgi:hypothetical protein